MADELRGGPYRCAIAQCGAPATEQVKEWGPAVCARHVEAGRLSVRVARLAIDHAAKVRVRATTAGGHFRALLAGMSGPWAVELRP